MPNTGKSGRLPQNWAFTTTPCAEPSERRVLPAATKQQARARLTEPYEEFVRQILKQYPKLRATRIFEMVRQRGYTGSVITLRRLVATVRPSPREVFLRLRTFPAEQAQVDWASFGEVTIGRARRKLSCMALILSYSRALYLEFFFDQSLENFLRAHVRALHSWGGCPRTLLYDNLKSVVLERRGDAIRFHPATAGAGRSLSLCAPALSRGSRQ